MDKGDKKQRITIKLICLLLSFGLWLYISNVENPIKTYTLRNVPVELLHADSLSKYDLAIAPNQEFTVDLKLEGDSKYVYSVNKNQFKVTADLSDYALKKGENNIPVTIQDYPDQINIKNDGYLSIKVNIEPFSSKELNVISRVNVNFASGIYKENITPTDEKVTVSGPESQIKKVVEVALVGNIYDISQDTTKEFELKPLDKNGKVVKDVSLNKDKGTLNIKVGRGKSVNIKTEMIGNLPSGYKLLGSKTSKNAVEVFGSKENLKTIDSIKTEPIDLSKITESTQKTVKLKLPNGITTREEDKNITVSIDIIKDEQAVKSIDVPVTYTGLNNSLNLENESKTVKVTIKGTKQQVEAIEANNVIATFDLSKYNLVGNYEEVPSIKLSTENPNITIESVDKVKFTVNKKEVAEAKVGETKVGE